MTTVIDSPTTVDAAPQVESRSAANVTRRSLRSRLYWPALSIVATISFQHLEIRHLRDKLAECHAEGITLENSNKALLAFIRHERRRDTRHRKSLSPAGLRFHASPLSVP